MPVDIFVAGNDRPPQCALGSEVSLLFGKGFFLNNLALPITKL